MSTPHAGPQAAPQPGRQPDTHRRTWAMAVLCLTQLMVILDGTIVNVALPAIRHDLGFSASGLSWVVNGFFVTFAGLLLLAGRLGDLVGARRVFLSGIVVFTLASAACGLAWSPMTLVVARALQGVGGALASSVVLGLIVGLYTEPAERARAFGVFAFVGSAGASLGVVSGGLLVHLTSWHWVFLVNVPIGVVALLASVRFLDDDRGLGLSTGLDVTGAVLGTSGLMLLVYGVTQVPAHGWRSATSTGALLVAGALVVAFVLRQGRAATPLVPRRLFAQRRFTLANAVLFTMTVGGFSFQFLSALYLQDVLGYGPLRTGLSYLAVTLAIAVSSLGTSDALARRFGAERVLVGGMLLFAGGMLLMARLPADGQFLLDVAPAFAVMGLGFGLAMPQATTLAMSSVTPDLAGLASGVVTTTQQVGGALGLGVVATFAAATGLSGGFALAAGALMLGAVLGAAMLPRRPGVGRGVEREVAAPTLEPC